MLKLIVLAFVVTGVIGDQVQEHIHEHVHDHSHDHVHVAVHPHHSDSHKVVNDESHGHNHEAPHGVVVPEYLKGFQSFARNLLKQSNYYQAYEKTGVVSYCPFTVGLLLANVNEQLFHVRSAGIVKALELPRENITNAYANILDSFLEDPNVKPSSTLYTPRTDVVLGPNFQKLHTVVDVLPLNGNPSASSYINRQVGISTVHNVVDRLVPHDPPFNDTASGVFVNTFYYKSNWEIPFTSVAEKTFYTPDKEVQVRTLEATGTFPYFENEYYSSVAIPLAGGKKQVIYVRPKKSVKEYLASCVQDIFTSDPATWYKRLVRVQVPYLNIVLGRNFQSQIDALGGTETSCCGRPDTPEEVIDPYTRHYMQPVVQVVSSRISEEGIELAIANGAQVTRRIPHGQETPRPEQVVKSNVENKPDIELIVESGKISRQARESGVTDFVVNNPFFVYLHDNVLGAVSFTAVRSTFDISGNVDVPPSHARHHEDDINTNFSEECKVGRWNCHHRH